MEYMGYVIEREQSHYLVTAPDGEQWREDTIEAAKAEIDFRDAIDNWTED